MKNDMLHVDQDEDAVSDEVSDEALESASGMDGRFLQTLESTAGNCC